MYLSCRLINIKFIRVLQELLNFKE